MHSGAIIGAYIAEGRILVFLLYCTITTVAQTFTWVNLCPLNLNCKDHSHTVTYTYKYREREGLKERKNRLLKIFDCDDCLVKKEEISVCFLIL